jgi:hypothetical protein
MGLSARAILPKNSGHVLNSKIPKERVPAHNAQAALVVDHRLHRLGNIV